MRRTDRLYALVEELRARAPRAISRLELADRLEVTPRTVERDILALQQAAVPIWSQRGRGGGYAIDPQWSVPPLNFDATEALAVMSALATSRAMPFAEAGRRAERKLLAAMTVAEAAKAVELAGRLRLGTFGVPATQPVIAAVEDAVVDRRVVELGYRDREGVITSRIVEAHGLHLSATGSYLVGWCRLRDAGRAFRLDRIVSVWPTEEIAPERELDAMLDWIDDAVPPAAVAEGGLMPAVTAPRRSWGPPRKVDNRSGSNPDFARAIARHLPDVTSTSRRGRTRFAVDGKAFLAVTDDDDSVHFKVGTRDEYSFVLGRVGRDEVRAATEEAWRTVASAAGIKAHAAAQRKRAKQRGLTQADVAAMILDLPGANIGPIWGQDPGFRIGNEKRTRFARFGPPEGSGVGNLLAPDDIDTLVLLRCPQRPAVLQASPERYFTTPHYGDPSQPGGVIVRLSEIRGEAEIAELAELIEDAWRDAGGHDVD